MSNPGSTSGSRGFTLVELMIAMALSLIVALTAVAFIVSLVRANSENLQVTRLTQELRSISEVIGREVRRARYVNDPVGLIGSLGATNHDTIDTATAGCIIFGYDEPPNPPAVGGAVSRAIALSGDRIYFNPAGTSCPDGSGAGDAVLSTEQVQITGLSFTRTGSRIDISVAGELANPPTALSGLSREFRQAVYIRSSQVN